MMDLLLWRCPFCETNGALSHRPRLMAKESVRCRACRAVWQVSRIMGNDYRLKVIEGPAEHLGLELPLAEWYDRMKASLRLSPLRDVQLPLLEGEEPYLHGDRVGLFAPADDPAYFGLNATPERWEGEITPRAVGWGRLLLTNERLMWQHAGVSHEFRLKRLLSVSAIYNSILLLYYEGHTYQLRFRSDSPLKWLTYIAHVGRRVKDVYGHTITTSNF